MEPRIEERGRILIAGLDFYGNPTQDAPGWSSENAIGKLWSRFDKVWTRHKDGMQAADAELFYELHYGPEDPEQPGAWGIMVGVEVCSLDGLPIEMCLRVLPAATYGVFTLKAPEVHTNWREQFFDGWLPGSGYEQAADMLIELYDTRRFKGLDDPDSEIDFLVPIRPSR